MPPLLLILVHPFHAAGRLADKPVWIVPFLILAFLTAGALISHHPAQVETTLRHLPSHLTAAERDGVREGLDGRLGVRALFLPARLLAGWSVFALFLFVVCRTALPGSPVRYTPLLALEVHCEAAQVAGAWLLPVLARILPAWLVNPGEALGGPLLNSLNISTFWYVALLAAGVSVLCAARPLKATLLVLLVWGSTLALSTAVFRLLRDALHLTV